MKIQRRNQLNKRAIAALSLLLSFVLLLLSGIVLHLADFAPFQPTRHAPMTVHNTYSLIFVISTSIHLILGLPYLVC